MISKIIIAFLISCSVAMAGQGMGPGPGVKGYASGGSYTYIFQENFEGTGFPSTYFSSSDSSATGIDYDYTTTPPQGAQSCYGDYVSSALSLVSSVFTSQTTIYLGFRFEVTTWTTGNGIELVSFFDNLNKRGTLQWSTYNRQFVALPYGGSTVASGNNLLTTGTQYYIKIRVVSGTGADSTLTAWYSTDGTTWTQLVTSTDGTFTGNWERIGFVWQTGGDYEIDDVRVSSEDFNY